VRLVLIRHADSEHSARQVIAGMNDCTGLTERGVEQVHALADRLHATGELSDCSALLCSPALRARQTAQGLARVLPVGVIEENCDLCEVHAGDADGLSWEEYRAKYGAFDLLTSPRRPFAPGGESWSDFISRVRATHRRLAERFAGRTVVAVSHAGFVVASILVSFDIPRPGTGARLEPVHASLTEWRVSDATWTLARYNDAGHLMHQG
jgi:broad specificity phosphatase PhoE